MEPATLVARCQAGDELAWESLVRRYQARLYGLAYHYLGDAEDARDVAQEIFISMYKYLDRCEGGAHLVPWMMRIARNACIDRLRRRNARPPAQDLPVEEATALVATGPAPDVMWEREEQKQIVHQAMQSMSELNREMIILKEMQGLRLEEIARMLDLPLGTVKSRSSRARVELTRRVLAITGENGTTQESW